MLQDRHNFMKETKRTTYYCLDDVKNSSLFIVHPNAKDIFLYKPWCVRPFISISVKATLGIGLFFLRADKPFLFTILCYVYYLV